ncbi:MAG: class I SAM-dependent methyltransferase [Eubacterium sp.]|nr:class I SAM-dependent methyltransferase [Eubacterium sp.]
MAEKDALLNCTSPDTTDQDYVEQAIDQLEQKLRIALADQTKSIVSEKIDSLTNRCRDYVDTEIKKWNISNREFVNAEVTKSKSLFLKEVANNQSELKKIYEKRKLELERRHTQEEMNLFRNTRLTLYKQEINTEIVQDDTANHTDIYTGIDYLDFENHFRGSRQEIKDDLSVYLPYFKQKEMVLDLGCGRGEFLELLKENGISGIGVDHYEEFVAYCKAKGLNAVCEDALNYLFHEKNNRIGGIFASQLIEHLTNNQLLQLCHLAYEKLETGGCLILETPNPMCLSIYMNAFYVDPSHQKPVHPKTMEYLLKREGFQEVEILFTEASKSSYRLPLLESGAIQNLSEFNDGMNLLSDLLFGSQDYAIIARK